MEKKYIDLGYFLSKQFKDGKFYRYDLMVRYLFVKNFYANNCPKKFRYKLYSKFYKYRKVDERSDKFIKIIKSFEKNGFVEEYKPYIIMNNNYKMCGGNHRTACCLWFNIKTIPVYIPEKFYDVCKRKKRCWDKDWLISHDLGKEYNKLEKLRKKIFKEGNLC